MEFHNIFPTPVARFELSRDFTAEEINFYRNQDTRRNIGNSVSENRYVFNHETMSKLKDFVQSCVDNYLTTVYAPRNDVKLRITQSWINYSNTDEWHHKHAHPNSFVSGVLYMKALRENDKIYFWNEPYHTIHLLPKEWNIYNSRSWWLPVNTGDLMVFPSSLTHSVQPVQSDERISLAFNTFLVGQVGEEESLSALDLRD